MAPRRLRHKPFSLLIQQCSAWLAKIMSQIDLPSFLSVRRLQTPLLHSFFESNQDIFFFLSPYSQERMPKNVLSCLVVTDGESHEIAPVPLLDMLAGFRYVLLCYGSGREEIATEWQVSLGERGQRRCHRVSHRTTAFQVWVSGRWKVHVSKTFGGKDQESLKHVMFLSCS